MNRRDFVKSGLAVSAVLSSGLPMLAESRLRESDLIQHLSEFDDNIAVTSTALRAFGTLTYGRDRPNRVYSSPRMFAHMWRILHPQQRQPISPIGENYSIGYGLRFCGASWFPSEPPHSAIILRGDTLKTSGWYWTPQSVLDDAGLDADFETIQRSLRWGKMQRSLEVTEAPC